MNSKIFLYVLIVAVPIALIIASYYLFAAFITQQPCNIAGKQFVLCCEKNGNLYACDKNSLRCGQTISYEVNVSKFELPNFYFVCSDELKLNGSNTDNANYFISEENGREFVCLNHLIRNDQSYDVSNKGMISNISGKIDLVSLYVYSVNPRAANFSSDIYSNISYFIAQKDAAKVFGLDGTVKC